MRAKISNEHHTGVHLEVKDMRQQVWTEDAVDEFQRILVLILQTLSLLLYSLNPPGNLLIMTSLTSSTALLVGQMIALEHRQVGLVKLCRKSWKTNWHRSSGVQHKNANEALGSSWTSLFSDNSNLSTASQIGECFKHVSTISGLPLCRITGRICL